MNRKITTLYTPAGKPGFLGPGHTARPVIRDSFSQSDPFILLMDDILDKKDTEPAGGPHPHAGFETVTLILEGELEGGNHSMKAGDFQIMTAGSGIVHTETIDKKTKMRILQMWLTLPEKHRWATPRLQDLPLKDVPVLSENGLNIKVYSGTFAGLTSPVLNYVPLTVADIQMQPGTTTAQSIPASYNTFMYVIEGEIKIGEENKAVHQDQVAWLDRYSENVPSEVLLTAGNSGARFILYAAEPQGADIVSHGPFIGSTEEDIFRLYKEFREGKMNHVTALPKEQLMIW